MTSRRVVLYWIAVAMLLSNRAWAQSYGLGDQVLIIPASDLHRAGCGSGNFCPDSPLTRRQMAVFLSKALGLHWPN